MLRKASATRELSPCLIGTPETREEHRAAMAQRVRDRMTANDSLEGRDCHVESRFDHLRMAADGARGMQEGRARGETRIGCPKGIAHRLPDLTTGHARMPRDLVAAALARQGAADRLFPITPIAHPLAAIDAASGITPVGQVLAATRMEGLDRDGDAIRVRIEDGIWTDLRPGRRTRTRATSFRT